MWGPRRRQGTFVRELLLWGNVERQIQTGIDEHHALTEPVLDADELSDLLVARDRFSTETRSHQGLGYLTPMAHCRDHSRLEPTVPVSEHVYGVYLDLGAPDVVDQRMTCILSPSGYNYALRLGR
jgi:hypothetical protein